MPLLQPHKTHFFVIMDRKLIDFLIQGVTILYERPVWFKSVSGGIFLQYTERSSDKLNCEGRNVTQLNTYSVFRWSFASPSHRHMVFIYPVEFQEYMPRLTEAFVEARGGKQLIKQLFKKFCWLICHTHTMAKVGKITHKINKSMFN